MKPVTLVMAYYDNPGMLAEQARMLATWPAHVKAQWSWHLVDDGSPRAPATLPVVPGLKEIRLYRCKVDVPWNQDFCRNLGVDQATTQWVLMTDIDHLVPPATAAVVCEGKHDARMAYGFCRVSASRASPDDAMELSAYHAHPNSYLMTRSMFWLAGGYDERLAGHYGTDGDFAKRLRAVAPMGTINRPLIRVPRAMVPDASTTTYARKSASNTRALATLRARNDFMRTPIKSLSFPWERVA